MDLPGLGRLERFDRGLEARFDLVVIVARLDKAVHQLAMLTVHIGEQGCFKIANFFNFYILGITYYKCCCNRLCNNEG